MYFVKGFKKFNQAVKVLKNKGAIVYPTETVYGLGCDSFDKNAVDKIFLIKGREFNKPLPLIAANRRVIKKYFDLSEIEKRLIKKYWPGALTLILKNKMKDKFVDNKVWQQEKIAVRVSENKLARKLAKKLGGFIVSTSANVSSMPACLSMAEVKEQFRDQKNQPDYFLDGGVLDESEPSTIIEVVENGEIKILRQGTIKI